MKQLNLGTIAIVSTLVATSLVATVLIALVTGLLVANNQRDSALASCERGNVAREALRATASIIQDNLAAASEADRGSDAVATYAANTERLAEIKQENPELDCEAIIPEPGLIP